MQLKSILFHIIFICILLQLIACQRIEYSKKEIKLTNWQVYAEHYPDTFNAKVPDCIHLDLLNSNKIPDPFFGRNEQQLQWIDSLKWIYETTFEITASDIQNYRHHDIVFEGIDTHAKIYMNDTFIASADNMFRKWTFDVKEMLTVGKNELRIVFIPAEKENKQKEKMLSYILPDNRVFSRKAPYQFGWDWGPKFVTSGIWQPAYLQLLNTPLVENIFIQTKKITKRKAEMMLSFEMQSDVAYKFDIQLTADDQLVLTKTVEIEKGSSPINIPFVVENPKLWWSRGTGDAYLYNFELAIFQNKQQLFTKNFKTGIRTIELVQVKDSIGKSFKFQLNGKDIFIKGGNYIPQDNFLTRVDKENYLQLLQSTADVNMNMLRVWGGGIYENDVFYDLCDSLGLLVWQDFMFACAMYPGDSAFFENVSHEIDYQVKRLRNHPSISLWCGNNEVDNGWKDWGWQKQFNYSVEDSLEIWNNYQKLFHQLIPKKLHELDTTRIYWPSSPKYGWGHEEANQEGDSHYWGIWWGEEPFGVFYDKVPRFMSEYGFQSFPVQATIDSFLNVSDQYLFSEPLKVHQKHPRGFALIEKYMDWYFPVPGKFDDFHYVSQLLQAYGMEIAIEAHRLNKPYCMGTLYWQLNDCWPVVSWSTIDYYGNWKAAHYALHGLYNNILIASQPGDNKVKLYLVSDDHETVKGQFEIKVMDFLGNILFEDIREAEIQNTSKLIYTVEKDQFEHTEEVFILSAFIPEKGKKKQAIDFFVYPKDLELLNPGIAYALIQENNKTYIDFKAFSFAKDVCITIDGLNCRFSDNFFDLMPNQPKRIKVFTQENFNKDQIRIKSLFDVKN